MKNKLPNILHSERHVTRQNMQEVCLEKTIESCLKDCVIEKFAYAAENPWLAAVEHFACSLLKINFFFFFPSLIF